MQIMNTNFVHPKDALKLEAASQQDFLLKDAALQVRAFENAVICPLDQHGGLYVDNAPVFSENNHFVVPPPPQTCCDEAVVYVGSWSMSWGHEITDHLSYLWFYFDQRFIHLTKLRITFALSFWTQFPKPSDNFFEMVEAIGIPREKFLLIDQPTRFSQVFVPDPSFLSFDLKYCRYTKTFLDLLNRLPKLPAPEHLNVEKVYFSRLQFQIRKDFNEKDIECLFKKHGFTIIYPEQLDFLTELAILQNCKIFTTTEGSIAHNLLFCKDGTKIIILRKSRRSTIHQFAINNLKKADVIYIDAAFSPLADWRKNWRGEGPFFLYETKYLRSYFGLKSKTFPLFKFLNYLRLYLPKYINDEFLVWTHPIRHKLKIGTRLRKLFKIPR